MEFFESIKAFGSRIFETIGSFFLTSLWPYIYFVLYYGRVKYIYDKFFHFDWTKDDETQLGMKVRENYKFKS